MLIYQCCIYSKFEKRLIKTHSQRLWKRLKLKAQTKVCAGKTIYYI